VLIFDLPGHGLSSGEPAVIDDFADYSRAIADVMAAARLPQLPLWVMAQSTGGAALADYARRYPWPFTAAVLLAPLIRTARWHLVRGAHELLHRVAASVPRGFAANSADQEFLAFVKSDPLQSDRVSLRWLSALRRWIADLDYADLGVGPALVIQGEGDTTVDWRYNLGVYRQLFPGSRVKYLPGAGHHLANESEDFRREYLEAVAAWLDERGVPLLARKK
jgi:lysophospholipase